MRSDVGREAAAARERVFGLLEAAAPWMAGVLLAVPILIGRYPPMGDLAMHEALVAILRHHNDPGWAPVGLYYVVAPQHNQMFAWIAYLLSGSLPTDVACKIVVAATVLTTIPAMAHLLRQKGRSPWLSLLMGPVACGWMFRWGLVANMTGFAVLLLAVPSLERLAIRPSLRALLTCLAAVIILLFAHESSAILFAVIAAVFALVRGRSFSGIGIRVAPAAAVLGLAALQWRVSKSLASVHMESIGTYFGAGLGDRLVILPGAVFGGIGPSRLAIVGGLFVASLVASAIGTRPRRGLPRRVAWWRARYATLAALFFALYLAFPMALGGATLLAHRFLPGACACLVVACAARRRSWLVVALSAATPLALLVLEMKDFAKADLSYRALDRIIALVPYDVAVAQLDLTPRPRGHVAPVPGAASRVQAERGGRMLFAMTDMPPNPVYVPRAFQWNEPVQRLAASPYAFVPAVDLRRFAYLVVRNENTTMLPLVARALAPEAELVGTEREWALFRSRLPTVPLTAPDGPPPGPGSVTLAARIERILAESRGAQ